MICEECETVAHCMKNGCVPKTTKKDEALKLALEALDGVMYGDNGKPEGDAARASITKATKGEAA